MPALIATPAPNDRYPAPPTTIKSFLQMVLEADPDYYNELYRPVIYEFSNGRKFKKDPNVYTD